MSSFCHSPEPKRTSIAKGTKLFPLLSALPVAWVTRSRRSRGGGRPREKRRAWFSEATSGWTSPSWTLRRARSTSDPSSAEARDGTNDETNAHETSQRRDFTADPFDRAERNG